ncbi:MAG: hypothetical protein QOE34_2092 [Verrucomicrobiota bacterium]|jgi:hypothetical protein
MHRDKPPGLFDFADQPIRHLVGFWLTTGFILSILVHIGMLVWRSDVKASPRVDDGLDAVEKAAVDQRPPSASATPAPSVAVHY